MIQPEHNWGNQNVNGSGASHCDGVGAMQHFIIWLKVVRTRQNSPWLFFLKNLKYIFICFIHVLNKTERMHKLQVKYRQIGQGPIS